MQDLHELPKLRDGLSYLYLEHGKVERTQNGVEFFDADGGRTLIPSAALAVLMLGPGTSITHEGVKVLVESGGLVMWTGEQGVRFYAQGYGETRKAYHLLKQAELVSDPAKRIHVVLNMYRYRFAENLDPEMSLEEIRGHEGVRVREAYAQASRTYGVPWHGRRYDRANWNAGDPVNRALSVANACLNGICHAGIVSGGYSPGLGFIHTGKQLSFVYDIADLYKVDVTLPLAFRMAAQSAEHLETRVRYACREAFREKRLLDRILPDIDFLLGISAEELEAGGEADSDPARPEPLWDLPPEFDLEVDGDGRDDPGDGAGLLAR
jgi:CRISP-associated protein Cas1